MEKTLSENVTHVMVFNAKGGVGKTAIALNLALTHNYGIVTNDRLSIIDQVLPDDKHIILPQNEPLPEISADWPIIYDFGGYPDERVLEALKISQFVLVPVLHHAENIQTNLDFVKELLKYKKTHQIILIVNQLVKGKYGHVKEAFREFYPDLPVFHLKKSTIFSRMSELGVSIEELAEKFKLHARHYRPVAEQFNQITEYMLRSEYEPQNLKETSI